MKIEIFWRLLLSEQISNVTTRFSYLERLAYLHRKQVVSIPVKSFFLKPPITANCLLYYHFQNQESKPGTWSVEANMLLGNISIDYSFSSTTQTITPNFTLTNQTLGQLNSFIISSRKQTKSLLLYQLLISSVVRLLLNPTLAKVETRRIAPGGKTMEHLIALGLSAYDDDPFDKLLAVYESLIQTEVRKAVRSFSSDEILELEIDELAQAVRIKLWKACQKQSIKNPKAYITAITRTTAIDIIRRHKPVLSLSDSACGKLDLCDLLMAQNEGFQDPALEIELEEVEPITLARLVEAILSLPPRQKHAVLLAIKDHQADCYLLIGALKARGVDIETISQPEERSELYLLRASLSAARKKLRALCERKIAV